MPPGKYDIFIIPEHSAGSGFLYLPSLRTNTNSFIAGFATALVLVVICQSMAPAFQAWWANFQGMGNAAMLVLVVGVGLGAWSIGRQTSDSSSSGRGGGADGGFFSSGGGTMPGGGGFSSAGSSPHSAHQGPTPNGGAYAHSPPPPGGSQPSADKPNGSYQRPPPQPQAHTHGYANGYAHAHPPPPQPPPPRPQPAPEPQPQAQPEPQPEPKPAPKPEPKPEPKPQPQPSTAKPQAETPKNSWEKAREEMRRKEEERKAKEAEDKRRADAAARLKELREKEAKERAAREAEKARREAEAKAKAEAEAREARAKELRERLVREREERRKKLEEEKKRKEEEAAAASQARASTTTASSSSYTSSSYAYSGVGEKTNPWPTGKPPTASPQAGTTPASPTKKPPAPTARTYTGTEEEAYSYRPYDQPNKRPGRRASNSDLSESSWAPSQSTARTTPPPSVRGPYSTKDPDKIVIRAVYCFMNQFAKTPASQLLSGVGPVTDGLVLRITTEGLFIDDDVRGVAQREWDVKAWTLKMVEVWCPVHFLACAIAANSPPIRSAASSPPNTSADPSPSDNISTAFFAKTIGGNARLRAAERAPPKTLQGDEADTYLTEMLATCQGSCRLGDCASRFGSDDDACSSSVASGPTSSTTSSTNTSTTTQTGDWKAKGLHLLRATIRDQEGKRYMFVIGEEEGWKVAIGLQRLRRGTQVRALGVAGLSGLDTKNTLEMLGWG